MYSYILFQVITKTTVHLFGQDCLNEIGVIAWTFLKRNHIAYLHKTMTIYSLVFEQTYISPTNPNLVTGYNGLT